MTTHGIEKSPLLQVEKLKTYYPIRRGLFGRSSSFVKAVDDVSLTIYEGETLGLVGESGCGKSTIGRSVVRLERPHAGRILFEGEDITGYSQGELRPIRTRLQMIFQDPYASLNPRMRIFDTLAEPIIAHKLANRGDVQREVERLLHLVGLPRSAAHRYPHEFSGGQKQRIGIARALSLRPKLIVCDEPVSALDVSIQAQILGLLQDLQDELKLSYLFIAHGIGAVKQVSTRIAVMYVGRIVELATSESLFQKPRHPYTKMLLGAYHPPDPLYRDIERPIIRGELPDPSCPPPGCRFHSRCPYAQERCVKEEPVLTNEAHGVACHYPLA